jgi:DNA polymerase I-like protein with 3'-5' exonuclease and polymerase domains
MRFDIIRTPVPVYVRTVEQALQWKAYFEQEAPRQGLGVDTETTGLDIVRDRIRFFSLAVHEARICGPVRLLPIFTDLLEDEEIEKRLSNSNYDQHLLANHGIRLRGHIVDTVDMDFCIDENRQGQHGLKPCALEYLGLRMSTFKDVFGSAGVKDEEVRTMCEIHDILELHDHEGMVEMAQKWARDVLLRLKRVEGDPEVLEAVKRLHLSLRAAKCTLTARQVVAIAEQFGLVEQQSGVHRYVSEFMQLLGAPDEIAPRDRKDLISLTESEPSLREATQVVYDFLLAQTGIPENPVEALRESACDYASLDSWGSFSLVPKMRTLLAGPEMEMITEDVLARKVRPELLLWHYETKRTKFQQILWNLERRGFAIDVEQTHAYAVDMQKELDRLERAVVSETGDLSFNPQSADQLRAKLFEKDAKGKWFDPFGDTPKKMTTGGASGIKEPSTDAEVLENFAGKGHKLSTLILEHRKFRKLHGDYMVGLPKWIDRLRRIHTSLNGGGARTWRLASSDPNLQNIPAKGKWGKLIRRLFVAGRWGDCSQDICLPHLRDVKGPDLDPDFPMRLVVADFKQLEMCILAHFSEDEAMIGAIHAKQDLHCKTVALASALGAAGLPPGITYEMAKAAKDVAAAHEEGKGRAPTDFEEMLIDARKALKSTGFGIVYGIGALKLGMQLGLPIVKRKGRDGHLRDSCPEAQDLIDRYLWEIFPGIGQFIERTREQCRQDLAVYTVIGHPRRLPEIISNDRMKSSQADRQAPNSRIQGSAADICNAAMDKCESDVELRQLGARMLMQVHDELIWEVPDIPEIVTAAKRRVKTLMENPFPMRVPILIDINDALNWGEGKG